MASPRYPRAHFIRSPETAGRLRDSTLGVVWHYTAGREPGDVGVLSKDDPRSVNVQFYIPKDCTAANGKPVYQFTETDERANHGFPTANHNMVGVEMESLRGEPWTECQVREAVLLGAWLSNLYHIPIVHCDPVGHTMSTWRGHCGHADLTGIDGNSHHDTVTNPPGWPKFIEAMRTGGEIESFYFEAMPYNMGGVGPLVLGQGLGYTKKSERDTAAVKVADANPGLPISLLHADDGRYYILGWGNPAGRDWYRSGNFADERARTIEMKKRRLNLPAGGKAVREFKGKSQSLYPWAA